MCQIPIIRTENAAFLFRKLHCDCELQSKESLHIGSELSLKELSYPTGRKVSYQE